MNATPPQTPNSKPTTTMASKQQTTPKVGTKDDIINQIKAIDPSVKGLSKKRKDDLIRILANLKGNPDTDFKALARENAQLREDLESERNWSNHQQVIADRQNRITQGLRLQNQRLVLETYRNSQQQQWRPSSSLSELKEHLQGIVETIDDLGRNDNLNSQASKVLNEELLKAYNMLTRSHWTDEFVPPPQNATAPAEEDDDDDDDLGVDLGGPAGQGPAEVLDNPFDELA